MKIILNGIEKKFKDSLTLKQIIESNAKDINHLIAEVNENIIKNPQWETTLVKDGDVIELVTFMGGG